MGREAANERCLEVPMDAQDSSETQALPDAAARRRKVSWIGLVESAGLLGILATVATLFGAAHWLPELTTHFRVQLAVALGVLAIGALSARRGILTALLAAAAGFHAVPVFLAARPTPPAAPAGPRVRLVSLNVHTANRAFGRVLDYLRQEDPDLILLLEVDAHWMRELAILTNGYPTLVADVREDNFGIALFSRRPLTAPEVVMLEGSEVPSIIAGIALGERRLQLLGTHPVPPASPDGARERDAQLLSIGRWAAEHRGAAVVLGDLNVTPWSPVFHALLREGRLRRPHPGWGIVATWQLQNPLISLPLDHCLVSPGIAVTRLTVGPEVGSDHRPLSVELAWE
ncbi:MAG: endonuclease/exonuclease/phosphatase family protein [Verrucomicrobia bacterium]|nr:endonuclease/exonuclease/phosphatase family protein [Verrucomicrobiota bacterium]